MVYHAHAWVACGKGASDDLDEAPSVLALAAIAGRESLGNTLKSTGASLMKSGHASLARGSMISRNSAIGTALGAGGSGRASS